MASSSCSFRYKYTWPATSSTSAFELFRDRRLLLMCKAVNRLHAQPGSYERNSTSRTIDHNLLFLTDYDVDEQFQLISNLPFRGTSSDWARPTLSTSRTRPSPCQCSMPKSVSRKNGCPSLPHTRRCSPIGGADTNQYLCQ